MDINLKELLQATPYIGSMALIKLLPAGIVQKIFRILADKLAVRPKVTTKLRDNLAQVLGTSSAEVPQELIVASMRSYLRYWLEVCRLPVMDKAYIAVHTEMVNWDRAEPVVLSGKGVIFVLPHSGNWDTTGVWYLTQYANTLYTVNERVKPELLYQKFVRYRESLGFSILPHDAHPFDILADKLVQGETVCLLVDRIVGTKKHQMSDLDADEAFTQVSFFDKPVWVTTGPARLAAETQVSLFAAYPSFTPGGWKVSISPPIDFSLGKNSAMQGIMDFFAENIREKPEDWHAMQRIWENSL